jgi:hypothetical protein
MASYTRQQVTSAAQTFYESLGPMDYLAPDSYRDLFKDAKTKALFVTLADKLGHIKDTYCK